MQDLRDSEELDSVGDSGAAENAQAGAETIAASVPDAIKAMLGIAGDFFSIFLAAFTILFICLFLLTDVGNLKRALASLLMPGEDERWLAVWERVTESCPAGRSAWWSSRRSPEPRRASPRGSSARATRSDSP